MKDQLFYNGTQIQPNIANTPLPTYQNSTEEEVKAIQSRLNKTFSTDVTKSYGWRHEQLLNIKKAFLENQSAIYKALSTDFKTFNEINIEYHYVLQTVNDALDNLGEWMRPERATKPWAMVMDYVLVHREPYGTILNISPWNFPFTLSFIPLIGAIAAGNCMVIKPSELTPNSSYVIKMLIEKYMDQRSFGVILGDAKQAEQTLGLRWDYIMYTGNCEIAKKVMNAASHNLTPVTLELGGKCPLLLDHNTVDLEITARRIAWGKTFNSGQVCIAVDYVICHKSVVDDLIKLLRVEFDKMTADKAHYTRMVNDRHFDRVVKLIPNDKSPQSHGKLVYGGKHNKSDRHIFPAIVIDPDFDEAPLMTQEIFGPILPIITVENIEDGIRLVKKKEKPLAFYLFSNDAKLQKKCQVKISSGSYVINDVIVQYLVPGLPFGGVGNSGIGAYHGKHTFEAFSHKKAVHYNNFMDFLKAGRYAPMDIKNTMPVLFSYINRPLSSHDPISWLINWIAMAYAFFAAVIPVIYQHYSTQKSKKD